MTAAGSGHRDATFRLKDRAGTSFHPRSTALLVIDPVNDFLSEGGAASELAEGVVTKHDVVGHLRTALDAAHAHGIPVLFAPMAFTRSDYDDQQLQRRSGVNRLMFERRMFLAGSWGADFHPGLQPEDGTSSWTRTRHWTCSRPICLTTSTVWEPRQLVIAGMAANLCCESTGRHATEHGYDVTFLRDAIGADNIASYEAAMRVNYPLIANAVLDVAEFAEAIADVDAAPQPGDVVLTADRVRLGEIERVVQRDAAGDGYLLVSRGVVFSKDTYIPLDAVSKVTPGQVQINLPRIVVHKMPWDGPPRPWPKPDAGGAAR